MTTKTHYPTYDVMKEQDAWDDHTQTIVQQRLHTPTTYEYITVEEAASLTAICALLVDDRRYPLLNYIVAHIDRTLANSPGEGQRKAGVPEASVLVRGGLAALYEHSILQYKTTFANVTEPMQRELLERIASGKLEPQNRWQAAPQQPFFQKLLSLAVEAYASHPEVWSEIGYAGPAYPRGYTRTGIGQVDPWEARMER